MPGHAERLGCLALGLCLVSPGSGLAQNAPATPAVRTVTVDVAKSRAFVKVGATGLGHEHGAEGRLKSGFIRLGALEDAGEIVFDMASFVSETPDSRKMAGLKAEVDRDMADKVNANMLGPDVLDVKQFPTATFRIRSALAYPKKTDNDPNWYRLEGELTMHGVTRALKVDARAEEIEGATRLRAHFSMMQTHYEIKPYTKLLGTIGVADELKVWGELWAAAEK